VTLLPAALLGVVQGLTEFLPISSSAHLILARAFFGWDTDRFGLPFDVACHVGTLIALLIYFRREIVQMLQAVPSLRRPGASGPARLALLLVVGTLPIVAVGLAFNDWIEHIVRDPAVAPAVAAAALAVGAIVLLGVDRAGARERAEDSLTVMDALAVGAAQAAALVPGVSRSGATIAMGIFLGLRRDAAARFGFLLGIPAVIAAAGHEALPVARDIQAPGMVQVFAVGMLVSGVVGYITVKYFIRYLAGHSLDVFAYYRLALAAATGFWLLGYFPGRIS
jgi:undecaprenyl-diphosphatase